MLDFDALWGRGYRPLACFQKLGHVADELRLNDVTEPRKVCMDLGE